VSVVTRARIALLAGVLALATAVLAPAALACPRGYSYAGLYSPTTASGIGATISMQTEPTVPSGHVAAWVGVGGPGLGPRGEDEWLQVGIASFGGSPEGHLYYELTEPGREPQYHELAGGIVPGMQLRVAVLELPFARDSWIVVSPAGIEGPFYLPSNHRAWEPIATAESYAGARCNTFSYRFGGIQVARKDGTWRTMRHGLKLQDPGWRLRRHGPSTFSATAA
jgi:hypothetical protein